MGHPALKQSEPPEYVTYGPTCNLKYVAILICFLQKCQSKVAPTAKMSMPDSHRVHLKALYVKESNRIQY